MTPDERFDAILDDLEPLGVVRGKMFGRRSAMVEDKAAFCLLEESLAIKLGAGSAAHARALALENAELFDPSGKGRPFRDWVKVPFQAEDSWSELALSAVQYLRSLQKPAGTLSD